MDGLLLPETHRLSAWRHQIASYIAMMNEWVNKKADIPAVINNIFENTQ